MVNKRKDFSKIYDEYIDRIYRFVYIKVSSPQIAEDIASEVFSRCWEYYKANTIDNPQAFLYQTARNLVVDHYREKGRTNIVSAEYAVLPDPYDMKEKAHNSSDIAIIKQAITKLSDDYQEVLVCHYIEDLPISEIAKITGKTEGAVRVTLHRAIKALREEV